MARLAAAAGCLVVLTVAVACRPSAPPPAPLQPDPQVSERRARQEASTAEFKATVAMTAAQVAELESALQKNPDDLETRKKLLVFYRLGTEKAIGWTERVAARRRHILWLIKHRPADRAIVESGGINPAFDPDGYAKAKDLWLAATSTKDVAPAALGNSAAFFWEHDLRRAERLLLRAKAIDPDGPTPRVEGNTYYPSWSARLGSLYVTAMLGFPPYGPRPSGKTPTSSPADAAFAAEARQTLAETRDAAMLTSAGQDLVLGVSLRWPDAAATLGFDPEALGVSYLERAARLDPGRTAARQLLAGVTAAQRTRRVQELLKDVPRDTQPAWARTLPEADRLAVLPELAESSSTEADVPEGTDGFRLGPARDSASRAAARAQARAYAEDTLALASKLSGDPNRGTAIFRAHVTLALQAMREGDMAAALTHMEAAGHAPPSDELRYGNTFRWQRLATGMLKRGEREPVARFLDRCAALSEVKGTREQMTTAAAAIRAGRMPEFYQYQTTSR